MRSRAQLIRNTLLLIAALVLVNLIGHRFKFRWDLTSDQRYTLSPATVKLLKELPEAVTVSAYFTEKMPPDLALARQDFKDLLVEYAARSNGNLVFEFIDPNTADSLEQRAQQEGIRPLLAQTREKDKAENLQVYMGAVVRMGDRKAVLPVIQQGSALEWSVSSSIKQVSVLEKPTIGFIQGHGEPNPELMSQLMASLSVMYTPTPMAIYDSLPIHERFAALVLVDPKDSIPPMQLQRLHEYLATGKGVVVAYSPARTDLSASPVIGIQHTGLENWLEQHGIKLEDRIVIDARCGQVTAMQQMGNFNLPVQIGFPYFPIISSFAEHPVSQGLDGVMLHFCVPVASAVTDSSLHYSPLLFTSDKSNLLPAPAVIEITKQWTDMDFLLGPQTVAAEVEGTFVGGSPSHLIVVGEGSFCVNGTGQQQMQLPESNVNLMVNAIDRATGTNDLLGLRGKAINYRPLDQISDGKRATLKWMNLFLPVAGAILYGIARRTWRRRQRAKRMTPGHVR